jgi:hypothetical protein
VGGADKVPTFAALIGAQKTLNVATLIDFQKSNQQMVENLYKKRLLEKSHVLTFADFTGTKEADIEEVDSCGKSLYVPRLHASPRNRYRWGSAVRECESIFFWLVDRVSAIDYLYLVVSLIPRRSSRPNPFLDRRQSRVERVGVGTRHDPFQ